MKQVPIPSSPIASGERVKLVDQAYQLMKQKIIDNEWPPGFMALEQELALSLGISRTPVHEALLRLDHECLIQVLPRRGMRGLSISPTDMREIYDILTGLECTAAELAASRPVHGSEMEQLEQTCADMEAALARDDIDAWAQADERFHRLLLDLSGNKLLKATVLNFWDRAHRVRMFTLHLRPRPDASTHEHRQLIEAIRSGDTHRARELHHQHRVRGNKELTDLLDRFQLRAL